MILFKIAIVGRPNVGKSSLFNLLVGSRRAVTAPTPGVTVDRITEEITWRGKRALLTDTGGIGLEESPWSKGAKKQVEQALEEADLCIFMVDVRDGLHTLDREIHVLIHKKGKPYLVAANKADNSYWERESAAFYELGVETVYPISVTQKKGIDSLMDAAFRLVKEDGRREESKETIPLAIVGRPNVGKSSLLNRLLGEERVVVSETPGTTRDSIVVPFSYKGHRFALIDTAGLRRKARVDKPLEAYSITRTVESVRRSHICILLVDAQEGPTTQDQKIAGLIMKEKKVCLLTISKADLLTPETEKRMEALLQVKFHFLPPFTPIYTSAMTGKGVMKLLDKAASLDKKYTSQIPTSTLNQALKEALSHHSPILEGKRSKIYYGTQVATAPPQFLLFTNAPKGIPSSYRRYLERYLAQHLGLEGIPIKLIFKPRR